MPNIDPIGRHQGGAVQRLHRRLVGERRDIDSLDDLVLTVDQLGVAGLLLDLVSRPLQGGDEGSDHLVGRLPLGAGAVVPFDLHRIERHARLPVMLGDHHDGGAHMGLVIAEWRAALDLETTWLVRVDRNHRQHTRHRLGLFGVEALDLAAMDRRLAERGVDHAGQTHIHAIDRAAIDDLRDVELGRRGFAQQHPLALWLGRGLDRQLYRRGLRGDVAIA